MYKLKPTEKLKFLNPKVDFKENLRFKTKTEAENFILNKWGSASFYGLCRIKIVTNSIKQ